MLRLIKPCLELEDAYEDFRADWKANHDKIIPAAVRGEGMNYVQLQSCLCRRESISDPGQVPATVFFLQDETGRILGAIDIRHQLNDYLLSYGGHIGYGIRPSFRGRGLGPKCSLWRCQLQKRWGLTVRLLSAIRIIRPRLKQFFAAAVYWKTNGLKTARLSRNIGFHYNKERPKCFKGQHGSHGHREDPSYKERMPLFVF